MIQAGMIYKAIPPLYSIKEGKKNRYFTEQIDIVRFIQKKFLEKYSLADGKNILSSKDVTVFLMKNTDYIYYLERVSNTYAINPYLLEIVLNNYASNKDKINYEKLTKEVDEDTLIISLSFCKEKNNVICINACFDNYAIIKIAEKIKNISKTKLSIFIPQCGRNAVSKMIYLSSVLNAGVFIGNCNPAILNPNIIKTLKEVFNIKEMTTAQNDFKIIKNI